jgi:hypothetical protein
MITYDPREMTWDQYVRLMAELFSSNDLGYVPEERWKDWVDGMNGIGYFVQSGVPDADAYEDWRDWAKSMCGIMNLEY